ncbi:MAG: hypothetical protein ACRD12_09360 [Acidimicrobiales bacterium]
MKALACELPSRLGLPLARLHVPDIAAEVRSRGIVAEISGTTIWRWLSEDAIRPWKQRSWIFPRYGDLLIAGAMASSGLSAVGARRRGMAGCC